VAGGSEAGGLSGAASTDRKEPTEGAKLDSMGRNSKGQGPAGSAWRQSSVGSGTEGGSSLVRGQEFAPKVKTCKGVGGGFRAGGRVGVLQVCVQRRCEDHEMGQTGASLKSVA